MENRYQPGQTVWVDHEGQIIEGKVIGYLSQENPVGVDLGGGITRFYAEDAVILAPRTAEAVPDEEFVHAVARLGDDRRAEWNEDAETVWLHLMGNCQE